MYTNDTVRIATNLAFELFGEKIRKGDGTPYIGHLLRVTGIVMQGGGKSRAQVGAMLHDVLEDIDDGANLIAAFGPDMVALVRECSDTEIRPKPPWKERKLTHIEHLSEVSKDALRIIIADKLDNARNLCHLANYADLKMFNASPHDIAWYYFRSVERLRECAVDISGVNVQIEELEHLSEEFADLVDWMPTSV